MNTFADLPNHATLQIAGDRPGEKQQIPCQFDGVNGKRLSLMASQRLPVSTALTVEYNDAMFLGEVIACTQDVRSNWHIEMKIEQILTGLQSLMNLRANLLGEPVPSALRMMPAGAKG